MALYRQKGSKVWWMSYSLGGRQRRKSTGTDNKKIAESIYFKVKTQIAEGRYFENSKGKDKTLRDLFSRYIKEVTPQKNPVAMNDEKRISRRLLDFLGNLKLAEVTTDHVARYVTHRRKKIAPATINRELAYLSATYNQAIKVWGWHRDNPVSRIKREKEQKRVKYFPENEFQEIFNLLAEWVKPIVLLAKNTGLRLSNVVFLEWSEVNIKTRLIVLDAKKVKNSHSLGIPMTQQVFEVLTEQERKRRSGSPHVFINREGKPYTKWGVYRAFKKACKTAGYPDYRFHDLRHDFCSKLVQAGVDIYTVKELAGHKNIATTLGYAHLNPERLKQAVSVLDYHSSIIIDEKGLAAKDVNP
ncbi:MAG: tyrosine-type recombinase/integrase [Candidatus Nitrohelix vancouverensis]|uniref:Tyrosine-type recombinase/integrase n=1 Tax=Candidatus Nitrohelix vancouverensis TaxID=2705534 RepID=A0A7T0G2V3_9BACT|nr:MAG: tyrosine-type recombinase/integrase [Candidatus Nitrohelix vancouverensis]